MKADVILLCEDQQTDAFVRRFLARRVDRRRISTLPLPHGAGSGEQWVRRQYPTQLKAIRQRDRAFLIVVTDADQMTTMQRRRQLDDECQRQNIPPRSPEDRAIIVTPKRNIETWLAWLGGDKAAVAEDRRHPKLDRERDCKPMADQLYRMCHVAQRLDEPCPPSLSEACEEYRRLRLPHPNDTQGG